MGKLLDQAAPGADYLAASLRKQFPALGPAWKKAAKLAYGIEAERERVRERRAADAPEAGALAALIRNLDLYATAIHRQLCDPEIGPISKMHHGMCSAAGGILSQARALSSPGGDDHG